jgi:hypothetical protein
MVLPNNFMFTRSAYSENVTPKKTYLLRKPAGKRALDAIGCAAAEF